MNRLTEDLRFFIGAFFLIVGALLCFEGIRNAVLVEGCNLNLYTGLVFIAFSAVALTLSIKGQRE